MHSRYFQFFSAHGKKLFMGTGVLAPCVLMGSTAVSGDLQCIQLPHYHWEFEEWFKSYDTNALRRGWQVYKEVCASCHPMQYLCFRHLVGVTHTNAQAKAEAGQAMIEDGPDEAGEMFLRPGVLTDTVPPPYKNDNAARAANNGALPPDLSLIAGARHGGPNYVFSLLIGYLDEVPPGLELGDAQYYNPVMEGGAISMPPPLNDGAVEYPDGTPATVTQMARDVSEFFMWSYWRYMDRSKQVGMIMGMWSLFGVFFFYWARRYMIANVATQRITYRMKPNYALRG